MLCGCYHLLIVCKKDMVLMGDSSPLLMQDFITGCLIVAVYYNHFEVKMLTSKAVQLGKKGPLLDKRQ